MRRNEPLEHRRARRFRRRRELRPVLLEPLEKRELLAADGPLVVDLIDTPTDDPDDVRLIVRNISGTDQLRVEEANIAFDSNNPNANLIEQHELALTTGVQITAGTALDQFTIDFSTPFDLKNNGKIEIAGGGGGDDLLIINGTFDGILFEPTVTPERMTFDHATNNDLVIEYTSVDSVTDTSSATDRMFTLSSGVDNVELGDDETADDGVSRFFSAAVTPAFTPIDFQTPTGTSTLDIDGSGDNDIITARSLDSTFNANISIMGGAGDDSVTVAFGVTSGDVTVTGGGDTDDLTVEGTSGADTLIVHADRVARGTNDVFYSEVEDLTVDAQDLTDNVTVSGLGVGVTDAFAILGGGGGDTIAVNTLPDDGPTSLSVAGDDDDDMISFVFDEISTGAGDTVTITGGAETLTDSLTLTGTGSFDVAANVDKDNVSSPRAANRSVLAILRR